MNTLSFEQFKMIPKRVIYNQIGNDTVHFLLYLCKLKKN